ncbi:flavin reductase family protein [Thermopolyspora sp. NPDC052614]|uniref:flavin reductase family protein n=1 Tax=Thermopolyspora sp. NPDC052614 TaxID=3155682 RepID=UPI00344575F3
MTDYESLATEGLSERQVYRLLTGIVVPRPIAWITTRGEDGGVNLAPFSAYMILANDPAMIGVSIGRRGAEPKDTARNIKRTGQFVVNAPHVSQAESVHLSAEELPSEVSEVEKLGFGTIPGVAVDVPRLDGVPIAMECEFVQAIEFGRAKTELIVGEVKVIHVKEGLLHNGKIDTVALQPLGRVAGPRYAGIGEVTTFRELQHTLYTERDGA